MSLVHFAGGWVAIAHEAVRVLPYALVTSPTVENLLLLLPELGPDFAEVFLTDVADDSRRAEPIAGTWQGMNSTGLLWPLGRHLVPFHQVAGAAFDIIFLTGLHPRFSAIFPPFFTPSTLASIPRIYGREH